LKAINEGRFASVLDHIREVRIARNFDYARIVLTDGREIGFCERPEKLPSVEARIADSYASEGVLSHGLLSAVAAGLAAG
jgi:hypothetical protein